MRLTPDFERTLRRYVLGDLEEDVRPELEELLLTDPDAFEALSVIEDELVEEYLEETGTASARQAFERHFLTSPERYRRLRFARALKRRASAPTLRLNTHPAARGGISVRSPAWRPAWVGLAAALGFSLIGNVWQASRYRTREARVERPSSQTLPANASPVSPAPLEETAEVLELRAHLARELERVEAEAAAQSPPAAERLARVAPAHLPPLRARIAAPEVLEGTQQLQGSRAPVVTFTIAGDLARAAAPAPAPVEGGLRAGGFLPRVTVPQDAVVVRLRLELPGEDYASYRAALLAANGDEIWMASKLRAEKEPGHPAVILPLPAELLPRGDYQVKLSGVSAGGAPEAVGTYTFRLSAP